MLQSTSLQLVISYIVSLLGLRDCSDTNDHLTLQPSAMSMRRKVI